MQLVRNIYAEGPEGDFERTKAFLERTLESEIERRAGAAASLAAPASAPAEAPADAEMGQGAELGGPRLGLLTFVGARKTRREKVQ